MPLAAFSGHERISPARTGSTSAPQTAPSLRPDHPRVYGEHTRRPRISHWSGSPPRIRGALGDGVDNQLAPGITPRVYGEHSSRTLVVRRTVGSPPRVRGARTEYPQFEGHGRITPAYGEHISKPGVNHSPQGSPPRAGSTRSRRAHCTGIPDYPRTCGEHVPWDIQGCTVSGSPRVYGEYVSAPVVTSKVSGLPPRVRGARVDLPHQVVGDRITPARTGSALHDLRFPQAT